jgi:FkbM family methyltransferase
MTRFFQRLRTLRNLNWRWALRYYGKKMRIHWHLLLSKMKGRTCWDVTIDGITVKLYWSFPYHHAYARSLARHEHEPTLLLMWKKYASNAMTIVDAGSYNGIYGLVAAKANPHAHVTIFEPDPINCTHIERNIQMNNLDNITLIPKALSGEVGEMTFKQHEGGSAGRITEGGDVRVETTTLRACNLLPDLIKLDIVGAEYDVLLKAQEILTRHPAHILLELYPQHEKETILYLKNIHYTPIYLYPRADGGSTYYFVLPIPS